MGEACQITDSFCWYVLTARTRSEIATVHLLENRGFQAYSPILRQRRRYSDRYKMCELAAFPGYVFCHFNLRDKARVLDSPGVLEIVSVSGKPAAVADREIEAVRRMMNQGARPVPYFACGQRVKIEYGALAGIEGILTRTESAHELTLSIKLLQRSISLSVDPDQVSIISKF